MGAESDTEFYVYDCIVKPASQQEAVRRSAIRKTALTAAEIAILVTIHDFDGVPNEHIHCVGMQKINEFDLRTMLMEKYTTQNHDGRKIMAEVFGARQSLPKTISAAIPEYDDPDHSIAKRLKGRARSPRKSPGRKNDVKGADAVEARKAEAKEDAQQSDENIFGDG